MQDVLSYRNVSNVSRAASTALGSAPTCAGRHSTPPPLRRPNEPSLAFPISQTCRDAGGLGLTAAIKRTTGLQTVNMPRPPLPCAGPGEASKQLPTPGRRGTRALGDRSWACAALAARALAPELMPAGGDGGMTACPRPSQLRQRTARKLADQSRGNAADPHVEQPHLQ